MIEVRAPELSVTLSLQDCWRLYVLLGDRAPFVRNRLSVIRHGGTGPISLSTPEEREEVLDALALRNEGPLSEGLRSLQTALSGALVH